MPPRYLLYFFINDYNDSNELNDDIYNNLKNVYRSPVSQFVVIWVRLWTMEFIIVLIFENEYASKATGETENLVSRVCNSFWLGLEYSSVLVYSFRSGTKLPLSYSQTFPSKNL